MKNKELRSRIKEEYPDEKIKFKGNRDEAIIGVLERKCQRPNALICYDTDLVPVRGKGIPKDMKLREKICEMYPKYNFLFVDYMDEAVLGVIEKKYEQPVICYDRQLVIRNLMSEQGMDRSGAWEWYGFNIIDAWVGEATPCFLIRN
jgi:hypothetical protein